MTQWVQCNFIQITPTWADAACNISPDTHDGFDEEVHKKIKKELDLKDKSFKSQRDRLRTVLERAWDGPGPVSIEVQALSSPFVERLESGDLRIDYASLEKRKKEVMNKILEFQDELRSEFAKRMAFEQDEEDIELLIQWS